MKLQLISFLFFLCSSIFAQNYKLGDVTLAELAEKKFPNDTAAAAAVLFKTANVFYPADGAGGFMLETKIKSKIKIYKKEGYEHATVVVPFYSESNGRERIQLSSAATYNEVNGKIVKDKIKDDGIFVSQVNEYWSTKTFVFPNVKEGSILEIEYNIESPRIRAIPDFVFQEEIPVVAAKMTTTIPDYFNFRISTKGNYTPKNTTSQKSRIEAQGSWSFTELVNTYELLDVPALPDEPFVANPNNYRSTLVAELAATRNGNGAIQSYAMDWQSVSQRIYKDDFSEQLKQRNFYENELDLITNSISSEFDKMMAVIKFLKTKVSWNELHGIYTHDGIKEAYKKKTGNFAEMNLLLISMLQHVGIKADPVLISTRAHGIPVFPSRDAFNGVICIARINNVRYLIDATDNNPTPNLLPARDLNWSGRYVSKDGYSEEIDLMPTKTSIKSTTIMADLSVDGKLKGNLRKQYTEHFAKQFFSKTMEEVSDSYLENIENELAGAKIENYKRTLPTNESFSFVESYSLESDNVCDQIAGKLQFKPLLYYTTDENPFRQELRESPIDFNFPQQYKYLYIIKIPPGYFVESMPQPVAVSLEDKSLQYRLSVAVEGETIRITSVTEYTQSILPAEAYPAIKTIFAKMVEAEKQRIVLAKKS